MRLSHKWLGFILGLGIFATMCVFAWCEVIHEREIVEHRRCLTVVCTGCYGACESPDTIVVHAADGEYSVGWRCYEWDKEGGLWGGGDCGGYVPEGKNAFAAGLRSEDDYRECHCTRWAEIGFEKEM